jgi:predicted DNA-binding ribbon-helix-helix protein
MVNVGHLKRKNSLGEPPKTKEIKSNLQQPENFQDGRSLHKTGRVHQLGTRVTPDFYDKVRSIAARDRLKIVELLEMAIEAYENNRS